MTCKETLNKKKNTKRLCCKKKLKDADQPLEWIF